MLQFRLNTIDEDMLKINSKTTGDKDAGTNTEFSLTNLTENLFCAKNQSKQKYKEIIDKNRTKKKRKKRGKNKLLKVNSLFNNY